MRAGTWTRFTDSVFEKADALVEWVDHLDEVAFSERTRRLPRMVYGFAAGLAGGLFVALGETVTLGSFAPRISAPLILIGGVMGALVAFKGRAPRPEPPRILLGLVLLVIVMGGAWVVTSAMGLPTQ